MLVGKRMVISCNQMGQSDEMMEVETRQEIGSKHSCRWNWNDMIVAFRFSRLVNSVREQLTQKIDITVLTLLQLR